MLNKQSVILSDIQGMTQKQRLLYDLTESLFLSVVIKSWFSPACSSGTTCKRWTEELIRESSCLSHSHTYCVSLSLLNSTSGRSFFHIHGVAVLPTWSSSVKWMFVGDWPPYPSGLNLCVAFVKPQFFQTISVTLFFVALGDFGTIQEHLCYSLDRLCALKSWFFPKLIHVW